MTPVVHILILAAGASSRMRGADKLVTSVEGEPLLRRVAATALATGAPVLVTLPPLAQAREAALLDLAVMIIWVPDAQLGMSRSLVRGMEWLAGSATGEKDGVMILPGDMPGFTTAALEAMILCYRKDPGHILRGTTESGTPGHPAIFPRDLWADLAAVTGDEGGRSVLQRHRDRVRTFPLPGRMAVLDLDTPEDWAAYLGHPPDLV
jgi:molybdenum cofactor cytidylyltransferase